MRLKLLSPGEMTPEQKQTYDEAIAGKRGSAPAPMMAWLNSPAMARHATRLGEELRFNTMFPAKLSEIAILVTAVLSLAACVVGLVSPASVRSLSLFWSRLHSFSSILRVYRRSVVEELEIKARGFVACTEILLRALAAGYTVREFPLTLTAREHGQSKIRILRTIRGLRDGRYELELKTTQPFAESRPFPVSIVPASLTSRLRFD